MFSRSVFLFIFVFLLPFTARAETALFFAPTRLELNEEKPVQEIRVTNMSSIARAYIISLENLVMDETGITSRVDNFEYSAKRLLRFVPRKFDLQPGERQTIRVMGRFSDKLEDGDYHSHLEFLEDVGRRVEVNNIAEDDAEARARMMAQVSYATAVPIVLSKGEITTKVDLEGLSVDRDNGGVPRLNMSILRTGNGQAKSFIDVFYDDGGTLKRASSRRYVPVYREIDKRQHSFTLELLDKANISSGMTLYVKLFDQRVSDSDPVKTYNISIP